jgi:hypothetical protein
MPRVMMLRPGKRAPEGQVNWDELRYPLAFGMLALIGLTGIMMLWLQARY